MKKHVEQVHEKVRKHVCEDCGFAASQKCAFKKHKESAHSRRDKLKCALCPFEANLDEGLCNHVRNVHLIKNPSQVSSQSV